MSSNRSNRKYSSGSGNGRILYDAHGTRVKSSLFSNKYIRFLLFYALPYLVINGIILLLVCSTPKISVEVRDTNNYISTEVDFEVKSLLPVKELHATLESEDVEYEKSGKAYKATVDKNGTFTVEVRSVNGMTRSVYTDISMLDDTAPSIDEASIGIEGRTLSFNISDTQSGVNFDSIYGIVDGSTEVYPTEYDKNLGLVSIELPKNAESIELHYEDMVGNARSGMISVVLTTDDESAEIVDETFEEEGTETAA